MRKIMIASVLGVSLCGCSKSELDRCIDAQIADWQQKNDSYQEKLKDYKPPAPSAAPVDIGGGITLDPNMLPPLGNPGTKEEAEARANLQCGKVYGKRS